jgi:integrative and conjugative element protein (TIGR02256 family)
MLRYPIGQSSQVLLLSEAVLEHFHRHRQRRAKEPEAGGQLFAELKPSEIAIVEATGPRPTDRRGRTTYNPDRRAEQREIDQFHLRGLHYVGDWHTHPCEIPVPSRTDINSIVDTATRSTHDLNGLVLIIVGTAPFPRGLRVSVYSDSAELVLDPVTTAESLTEQPAHEPSFIKRLWKRRK